MNVRVYVCTRMHDEETVEGFVEVPVYELPKGFPVSLRALRAAPLTR